MRVLIAVFLCLLSFSVFASEASVSRVDNASFGSFNALTGPSQWQLQESVCVYSTATDNLYDLRLTSAEGAFVLKYQAHSLPYTAKWNDVDSDTGAVDINYNQVLVDQNGSSVEGCNSVDNARLILTVRKVDLNSIPAGNYLADITINVTPSS